MLLHCNKSETTADTDFSDTGIDDKLLWSKYKRCFLVFRSVTVPPHQLVKWFLEASRSSKSVAADARDRHCEVVTAQIYAFDIQPVEEQLRIQQSS